WVGRGVKEKDLNDVSNKAVKDGAVPSITIASGSTQKENVGQSSTGPTASESGPDVSFASVGNAPGKSSYANVTGKPSGKKLNIHTLFTPGGKRVAYPVVANYVRNTWGKYGLVRSMFSSSTGLFSFQFSSIDGLDAMLENDPWFIRNNPLILKKWHPDENLLKEDVSTISVWVKLHSVPIISFSDDGLSAIATKLGTPLMLDSHTTDMCMQSWGRSSYARVMNELRAVVELKDNIVVAMPRIKGEGYYTCNIHVEYEWKPLRCARCKVLGMSMRNVQRIPVLVFQPVSKKSTANTVGKKKYNSESTNKVSMSNPFEVLTLVDNDMNLGTNGRILNSDDKGTNNVSSSNTPIGEKIDKIERKICKGKLRFVDDDGNSLVPTGIMGSDSDVEVVFDETTNLRISTSGKDGSD
ncbi:beta-caryophyllene synthase, partial [Tanacetum coccineum]